MTCSPLNGSLEWGAHPISHYLPLVSATAVMQSDSYEVNKALIRARMLSSVALSAIAAAALYFIVPAAALGLGLIFSITLIAGESIKTDSAVTQKLVEDYSQEGTPPKKANLRVARSPRLLQVLLDNEKTLHKGQELARNIFSENDFARNSQPFLLKKSDELFLSSPDPKEFFKKLTHSSFFWNPGAFVFLRKVLASKNPDVQEIVDELKLESFDVLKEINSPQMLRLLCQHGFRIKAQNAEGTTLLMHWVQKDETDRLCEALNLGANPLLTNKEGKKALDLLLPDSPSIYYNHKRTVLLQAEAEVASDSFPLDFPEESKSFFTHFVGKPLTVKGKEEYIADAKKIFDRMKAVVLVAFGAYAYFAFLCFAPHPAIAYSTLRLCSQAIIGLVVADIFRSFVNLSRSEKEAKRRAVCEYLTTPVPSEHAMRTIRNNPETLEMLLKCLPKKSPILNRCGYESGHTLLGGEDVNFETFKQLVDHGADLFAGDFHSALNCAIEKNKLDFLQYLDEQDLLHPPKNKDQAAGVWYCVRSKETAELLKNGGFDPNQLDSGGKTPLERLIERRTPLLPQAFLLVSVGADPSKVIDQLEKSSYPWRTSVIEAFRKAQEKAKLYQSA